MFPAEVFLQIYKQLSSSDIFTCQFVCHAWHTPAKRLYYEHMVFTATSSFAQFIQCINSPHSLTIPAAGQFVREVKFYPYFVEDRVRTLLVQSLHSLAELCPYIEVIQCLQSSVEDAIYNVLMTLPHHVQLPQLRRIPLQHSKHLECAQKFSQSIEEVRIRVPTQDYACLQTFRHLITVDIDSYGRDIYTVINLLNMCPRLKELKAHMRPINQTHKSLPCTLRGSVDLETLYLRYDNAFPYFSVLNAMIHQMKHLKSLQLLTRNMLSSMTQDDIKEFKALIQNTYQLDNTVIKTQEQYDHSREHVALGFLNALCFQPSIQKKFTSLEIKYCFLEYRLYESANNDTWITMSLPHFESEDRLLHTAYVEEFEDVVHELIINYENTQISNFGCDYLLETVMGRCLQLQSLTLIYGNYDDWNCSKPHLKLQQVSLRYSFMPPTFLHTLSRVCPNIKHLELYDCLADMMNNTVHYYMPYTNLTVLAFNLDPFKLGGFSEGNSAILKVILKSRQKILYYYTNFYTIFMKELSRVEGEIEMHNPSSLAVIIEFNDIQSMKVTCFGSPGIQIDLRDN